MSLSISSSVRFAVVVLLSLSAMDTAQAGRGGLLWALAKSAKLSVHSAHNSNTGWSDESKSYGTQLDGSYVLNQSELASCLQIGNDGSRLDETIASHDSKIKSADAELSSQESQLLSESRTVNNYNAYEVDAFNTRLAQFERLIEQRNELTTRRNNLVPELHRQMNRYKSQCQDKTYYSDDLRAASSSTGIALPTN